MTPPTMTIRLGPILSTSTPTIGAAIPLSPCCNAKATEVRALDHPNSSIIGSNNAEKP